MVKLLKKSFSFLTQGSTRKEFNGKMALEVMPKLIITHIVDMVEEKKHISVTAIRRLVNYMRLFRLFIELCPELEDEVALRLNTFINNVDKRIKDECPALGDLLAFVTISNKVKFQDLLSSYLEE